MKHTIILVTMSEWEAKRKKIRLVISIVLLTKKRYRGLGL